ncbi:3'-5' exonuclease [Kribbella albertanoniae]|uniref:Exonuclease domain-containing protein n=1 Tax=Kribbella albertanoniae TaxID=1266829 RepID=A0A4V6PAJ9_9ACTN|nr:3'-5' exonuclease [Kribbella albertanoniae]TDC31905.1 exonuclease domain-containing protein [Kribbella albertanoniae]
MRLLNVIDVEATCWEGEPPPGMDNEIIEIGLATIEVDSWRRVGKHQILVRPERSEISPFCTELTGLTADVVSTGVSFAEACELLTSQYGAAERVWMSWGDYDRKQFERQCEATGVGYPFGPVHVNAKARFAEVRGTKRRPGMSRALELAGLPLEGRHHSGMDDAWNIAALIVQLSAESFPEV